MLIAKPTPSGTYELFENGVRTTTTTLDEAKRLGARVEAPLPSIAATAQPSTATPQQPASPLLSFADTLNKAVNIAKQERNRSALDLMGPGQGTLAASDFGSILGHLNQASDSFAADTLEAAVKNSTNKFDTVSIDGSLYQVEKDPTGKVVGKPQLLVPGSGSGGGMSVPSNYAGEFGATIDLVGNAFGTDKQRNESKILMKNFIANKDFASAYALVQQSTATTLKGEAATRFQNQANTVGVLKALRDAVQAYAAAGGKTNILKGSADQIQTKLGALMTDPKYAALAVQLNGAFQNYRLQMTGAAFGAQESAEYASILPAAGNTLDLNLQKIEGALNYFNSSIESSIASAVGKGGVYIKEYAEGTSQEPAAPAAPQAPSGGGSYVSKKGTSYVLPNF